MEPDRVYEHLSSSYGKNHFAIDLPFQRLLGYFAPNPPDLSTLGAFAGTELYEAADYVDKVAPPRLLTWSVRGERVDEVWLDPGERRVLDRLTKEFGVNRGPYRGGNWFDHYAAIYLVSDPGIACILTLTNQTAYALVKYGSPAQQQLVPELLGETRVARYGATWFTEIQGGSDLGTNRVEAAEEGGSLRLTGDTKYFASNAGLADYALVSARPRGAPAGAKGLGLYLVRKLDSQGRRNFAVRRLKDKSATRSVPTGEVEFHGAEAEPVGAPEQGIYYIMEDLMVSRLANSFGALGVARKAYLEAYYFAAMRQTFGRPLRAHPLVQRDLMDMEIAIEGALALALRAVDQFERSWKERPPYSPAYHYARLLTHIAKNVTATVAAETTRTAMELLGGLGFLEEYPLERLHREALVLPIWEGPSNIQALDLLEVIAKKQAHRSLLEELARSDVASPEGKEVLRSARARIEAALTALASATEAEAQFGAKETLSTLGHGIAASLLVQIGDRLRIPRFTEVGQLYAIRFLEGRPYPFRSPAAAQRIFGIDEGAAFEASQG